MTSVLNVSGGIKRIRSRPNEHNKGSGFFKAETIRRLSFEEQKDQ
jgi:hypothetical protein